MNRHLLFDFDGTLVDSLGIGMKAFNAIGDRHGYPHIHAEDLEMLMRKPIRDRFNHYDVPMVKLPSLVVEFYKEYRNSLKELQFFEGIPEMLNNLYEAGYRISVMSSNDPNMINSYMKQHGVQLFHRIVGSSRLFGKDRMIRRYMRREKIDLDQILYVGDELRDIEACKKVGVPIIWVSYGFDHEELVKPVQPEFMAHSPQDVSEIVLNGWGQKGATLEG
ncbi:MAG: HAD-IA family hydrolase [Bacillota bacterium]|nr:HAD-IA family hydrolase [Bacillota bacterium]MDW7677561.1 HAD-IA family hydrolase [Bacillota bacterium]